MVPAAPTAGGALTVHQVLGRWAPAYLARFGAAMPARQRAVLQTLLACRTPALGGALHHCPECGHRHFAYHSCNDRHCPQCGGQDAWQPPAPQPPAPALALTPLPPPPQPAPLRCPHCGQALLRVGQWRPPTPWRGSIPVPARPP